MPWFHYEAGMTKTIRLDTERVYISATRGAVLETMSGRFERHWADSRRPIFFIWVMGGGEIL